MGSYSSTSHVTRPASLHAVSSGCHFPRARRCMAWGQLEVSRWPSPWSAHGQHLLDECDAYLLPTIHFFFCVSNFSFVFLHQILQQNKKTLLLHGLRMQYLHGHQEFCRHVFVGPENENHRLPHLCLLSVVGKRRPRSLG